MKKTVALIILDGLGLSKNETGNAVFLANKPTYNQIIKKYPHTTLKAHGESVGLFKGQMGNSEVGHLNLGAGRIVKQDSKKISDAIKSGEFFKNQALLKAFEVTGNIHIMGLLSNGGVHSDLKHLYALLSLAKQQNKQVYLHLFTDGRDSSPTGSIMFLKKLQQKIKELEVGKIASLVGRFFAMDRDKNYDRIEKAYQMLVMAKANSYETDPITALKNSHKNGITDEFLEPIIIKQNYESIKENDGVIFFNYRGDRARQITRALTDPYFTYFNAKKFKNLTFVGFTEYDATLTNARVAFYRQNMANTLGEVLSKAGKTQFRIAETTKYAHVTYFFNGGIEPPNIGEDRVLIQTKNVKTFDLLPQMSIVEVVEAVEKNVTKDKYDFVLINFANCDMVGHTGNLSAAIQAVEAVDNALNKVLTHFKKIGATCLVTADHGNAEEMITKLGEPHTAHTINPVPFILVDDELLHAKLKKGILSDMSATVLDLLNIEKPSEFEATSLIKKKNIDKL